MRNTVEFDIEFGENKENTAHFQITKLSAFESLPLQFTIKKMFAKTLKSDGVKDKDIFASIGEFLIALDYDVFTDIRRKLFNGIKHTGTDFQDQENLNALGNINKNNEVIIFGDDTIMVYELFYKALEVNYKSFLGEILQKLENQFPEMGAKARTAIEEAKKAKI